MIRLEGDSLKLILTSHLAACVSFMKQEKKKKKSGRGNNNMEFQQSQSIQSMIFQQLL